MFKNFKKWANDHQDEIILAGVGIGAVLGGYFMCKAMTDSGICAPEPPTDCDCDRGKKHKIVTRGISDKTGKYREYLVSGLYINPSEDAIDDYGKNPEYVHNQRIVEKTLDESLASHHLEMDDTDMAMPIYGMFVDKKEGWNEDILLGFLVGSKIDGINGEFDPAATLESALPMHFISAAVKH